MKKKEKKRVKKKQEKSKPRSEGRKTIFKSFNQKKTANKVIKFLI